MVCMVLNQVLNCCLRLLHWWGYNKQIWFNNQRLDCDNRLANGIAVAGQPKRHRQHRLDIRMLPPPPCDWVLLSMRMATNGLPSFSGKCFVGSIIIVRRAAIYDAGPLTQSFIFKPTISVKMSSVTTLKKD